MLNLPKLGVGIGFREPLKSELFMNQSSVDFLEITADHYIDASPEKERELEMLARHFTLIPHALNLSLGSAEGLDLDYVKKLAGVVNGIAPPWWSEHISFTKAGGREIGHLSPLPFTSEAVEAVCRNIDSVRRYIDAPLILENITYMVEFPGSEMSEAKFIREIVEGADCGILLDIANLHINSINQGYDPHLFLDELPLERVVQLHFVGGSCSNNLLIDSHSHPTPAEVWKLMEAVVLNAPVKGMVLERDENLPPFKELMEEMQTARSIWRLEKQWV